MFCPKCGGNIKNEAKFCNLCGADLREFVQSKQKPAIKNIPESLNNGKLSESIKNIPESLNNGKFGEFIKNIYTGKNKKRNIIITASATAAVIALCVVETVVSNPSNKIISYIDEGNYNEAADIFLQ